MGALLSRSRLAKRLAAMLLAAGLVLALGSVALANDPGSIDVTATGSTATVDGAIVFAVHDNETVTGTGTFEPFYRVDADHGDDDRQRGYNTEGSVEFGTDKSPTHRDCVDPESVPLISIGGELYWEFALDLNEADSGDQPLIDLIDLELYATSNTEITGYPFTGTATLLWETDETIHMRYPGTGQGRADYLFYIPASELDPSITCLVLYSEFANGDASFEEWKRRPDYFNATKTADGTFDEAYEWELTKSADPASQAVMAGDSGTVNWDVEATRTGPTETNHTVGGTVTLNNTGTDGATVHSVIDTLDGVVLDSGDIACPADSDIAGEGSFECTYSVSVTDGSDGTNHVRFLVDTGAMLGSEPIYIVAEASDDYTYAASGVVTNGSGQLGDDQIGLDETITDSADETGSTDHECSTDPGDYTDGTYTITADNTATLVTDDQSLEADASATIDCYIPMVSKTAAGRFDNDVSWDLTKGDDGDYSMLAGHSTSHDYTVGWAKTVTPGTYEVYGTVTVTNPHPSQSIDVNISDELNDGTEVSAACLGDQTIAAGATVDCDYVVAVADDGATSNTATVSFGSVSLDASDSIGDFVIDDTTGPAEVNITDDLGTPDDGDNRSWGPVDASGSADYSSDYSCPSDESAYTGGSYSYSVTNTATITETGDSDTATVSVDCYLPEVTKTADTSFTRTYNWEIVKDALDADGVTIGPEGLVLNQGQAYDLMWLVTADLVDGDAYDDSGWSIDGVITVANNSPLIMANVEVRDMFGATALNVDCDDVMAGYQTMVNLAAGASVDCGYSHAPGAAIDGTNTATATLQTGASATGTAAVSFGDATITEVNATVVVTDHFMGGTASTLGTVTVSEAPKTFSFSTLLSSDPVDLPAHLLICGPDQIITNKAIVSNYDTGVLGGELGFDSRDVPVTVLCGSGCSLTQGYWKTHNDTFWGGAPTDETWQLIGDADGDGIAEGELEEFFSSGQSWFDVMHTPTQGNPYYQLAKQWIAATLNGLNEADTSAVAAELAAGQDIFENNTPEDGAALKGRSARAWRDLANTLDDYNNGLIGPGHCDEDYYSKP